MIAVDSGGYVYERLTQDHDGGSRSWPLVCSRTIARGNIDTHHSLVLQVWLLPAGYLRIICLNTILSGKLRMLRRPKPFYGWYIVAACALISLYVGGVVNFAFTAVFAPLNQQFGWNYAQISLASSIRSLELGLLSAVVGLLVDRLGPRKLLLSGVVLIFFGYLLFSRVSSLAMFYASFALISAGMGACTGTVVFTPITHWFRRKSAVAIGIVTSGFALGGLLVPVVTELIGSFDWRTAMLIVGAGTLVICLPLGLVVRRRPEDYGYLPDGDTAPRTDAEEAALPEHLIETNVTVWRALRERAFWHITLSSMCLSFVVGALVAHVMPYLGSVGVDRSTASLIALLLPVVSIGGRLSGGSLTRRIGNHATYTASFLLATGGLLFFSYVSASDFWLVIGFIAAFSLGWGFNVIARIALLRQHFGTESFGAVLGFSSAVMMIGNMSGPPVAGWSYDTFGTYHGAWLAFAGIVFAGMLLALTSPSSRGPHA